MLFLSFIASFKNEIKCNSQRIAVWKNSQCFNHPFVFDAKSCSHDRARKTSVLVLEEKDICIITC